MASDRFDFLSAALGMVALLVVPGQDHSLIPLEDPPGGQVPVLLRGKRVLSLATVFNTVAVTWLWGTAVMGAGLPLVRRSVSLN